MRTCPHCHTQYSDETRFCLNDGTVLAEPAQYENPTESFTHEPAPAEPGVTQDVTRAGITAGETATVQNFGAPAVETRPQPAKSSSLLLPLLAAGFLFGILLLFVGAVGIWFYLRQSSGDIAATNANSNSSTMQDSNSTGFDNTSIGIPNSSNTANSNSAVPANVKAANDKRPTPTPTPAKPDATRSPTFGDDVKVPPPPTPGKAVPKMISGGVLNGKAISLPKPPYPPVARAVHASGSVSVQVVIDESGRVLSASAVSGHPLLRNAAENAARGARFSPTMISGQPVKVSGIITYNFVP